MNEVIKHVETVTIPVKFFFETESDKGVSITAKKVMKNDFRT